MRVALIGADLEENLALRYLASSLEQAGHSTDIVRFDGVEDEAAAVAAVCQSDAELVGLSMAFQRRAREFGALATVLRGAGYRGHLTCGGHFPTFAYRELLASFPALDSVVRHEGEPTLPELCAAVRAGGGSEQLAGVRGVAYRLDDGTVHATEPRPLVEDLDALPFPKRIGKPQIHMGVPAAFLVGSRGCYGHCTFCCINAFVHQAGGPKYRERSADNIADEIALLRRERGARMLVFHDDDFFTRDHVRDLRRVTALRDALRGREVNDVALVVKARPDDLDEQVFDVLDDIGLLRVYVGVEAGSTQGLRTLGRGVDMQTNDRALDFLRRRGVYGCFNMLIFDPDTTLDSLRASLGFLRRNADVPMNFCRTEIYVGTPLHRRLAREGRLRGDVFGWDYAIGDAGAQRVFEIFARAFYDRNFRCDGLMNSNLGLGYHLHLLERFFPRAHSRRLSELALTVIERVNRDCVEHMSAMVEFAASDRSANQAAQDDFTGEMCERVTERGALLEEQVSEATRALLDAARGRRPRQTPLWRSVAAATLALSPLACDPLVPPPPPDPLPPPDTQTDGAPPDHRFATPPPGESADAGVLVPLPPPDPPPPPPDPLPPPNDVVPPPDPPPPPNLLPNDYAPPPNDVVPPPDPPPPPHRQR